MTCVCGHVTDDHSDGFRVCTVSVLEVHTDPHTGSVATIWVDCVCPAFEADLEVAS